MREGEGSAARARRRVWIAGTILSLGYYFRSAFPRPHRTRLGVERRLFGLENGTVRLMESPTGGRWMVSKGGDEASKRSVKGIWDVLSQAVYNYQWPPQGQYHPPPRLTPLQFNGTWQLDNSSLRHIWDHNARGWLDAHRLWLSENSGYSLSTLVLDLRSGRTLAVDDVVVRGQRDQQEEDWWSEQGPDSPDPEHLLRTTLASVLEELSPDFAGGWEFVTTNSRSGRVFLVTSRRANGSPVASYAVTDEAAPRLLRLVWNARLLAMSQDGRTLFFKRDRALWRLDLRKPLAALLAEVEVPALPDPLSDR
jgi:hypothetical protein